MPIERNPKKPQTFRVGSNGKPAQTEYQVITSSGTYSLVELRPTTGRTHQLRVHLEQQGHPIVGDTLYGGLPGKRLYLHAKSLELTLPNRERKVFVAPVPESFNDLRRYERAGVAPGHRTPTDAWLARPSHALILIGPTGSGKRALAELVAGRLLAVEPAAVEAHAYVKLSRRLTVKRSVSRRCGNWNISSA